MEPLHPEIREALKLAHPGLTDADIDRHEALLSLRMQHDPATDAERIGAIDAERLELVRRLMPRYEAVVRQPGVRPSFRRAKPPPVVITKPVPYEHTR